MTLFPNKVAPADVVMSGEEVVGLPIADFPGETEVLQPIGRLDQLFGGTSAPGQPEVAAGIEADIGPLQIVEPANQTLVESVEEPWEEPPETPPDESPPEVLSDAPLDVSPEGPAEDDLEAAFEQGWEMGHSDAMAAVAADREVDDALTASLVQALGSVEAAIDRADTAHNEANVELALELARLVLGRELEVATNPGRDALVRCLGDIPAAKPAVYRFHPDDLARLKDGHDLLSGRPSELVADPTVGRGDVLVDIDGGLIDGGVMSALDRVAEVLRK